MRLVLPDLSLDLRTDRGVFSAGRIDPGTKVLLLETPPPAPRGHLLDLGCGYGPIALTLAVRAPGATVWAVDVNERALELTRRNVRAAGLDNVRVVRPEEVPEEVRFAGIWSNPPVRIGKRALHELLTRWLARLEPDRAAVLVVHKHLGSDSLHRWLAGRGWRVTRLASRLGYRLLEVRPPAAAEAGPGDGGGRATGTAGEA
ncbi:MAG TPA: methyltransferase [Acidimicrobiales bacterium]|nr:methyltransferase [Acidimicrobiales bacterium]